MDHDNRGFDCQKIVMILCTCTTWACGAASGGHEGLNGGTLGADASVDASSDGPNFNMPPNCVELDARAFPSCQGGVISASNYADTCQSDSDCTLVEVGDFCEACQSACGPFASINNNAYEQYQLDVDKTPGGAMGAESCAPCCGVPNYVACCQLGHCQMQLQCTPAGPPGDAGGD
jgi:hypothetical protein